MILCVVMVLSYGEIYLYVEYYFFLKKREKKKEFGVFSKNVKLFRFLME